MQNEQFTRLINKGRFSDTVYYVLGKLPHTFDICPALGKRMKHAAAS